MNKYPSIQSDLNLIRQYVSKVNEAAARILNHLEASANIHGHIPPQKILLIQQSIADHYSLPLTVMNSKLRTNAFVKARQIAMYLSRELTRYSLQCVADCFSRDHGTVIHACVTISDQLTNDPIFANEMENIRRSVNVKLHKMDSAPLVLSA